MSVTVELKKKMKTINLTNTIDIIEEILMKAEHNNDSYITLLNSVIDHEINTRNEKQLEKRLKLAAFPQYKTLDEFDLGEQQSLSMAQFKQLRELVWLENIYNLILLGPPGVGKTFLAAGLGIDAVKHGYKVSFVQMDSLIQLLRTQEIARSARAKLKQITNSDLVIIDDLMFMAMEKFEANLFFQLINKLYGQTSIIITSNKGPEDWGELLVDPAITTAILDRIVHKCQVINLCGNSYRIKHRQTIFDKCE
jgi:DNA replication protein DnaC